jgi:hypothetical protein
MVIWPAMLSRGKNSLLLGLALAASVAAQSPAGFEPGRRGPQRGGRVGVPWRVLLDAHYAYPYQGRWSDRIERALATGTPLAIEQDLLWRPATSTTPAQSIVSHGEPFTGEEPTLRDFFERIRPIATQALTAGSREQWPLVTLNLDFKDSHPQHFAAIWNLLGEYEEWLTTARRTANAVGVEPLQPGPVLVLTGSDPAQQIAFHDTVPVGSRLRVFGAVLPAVAPDGAMAGKLDSVVATNYRRWSNNPWSVVEPEGQNNAGEWTTDDAQRLRARVRAAHDAGLWIRFYTLNGHSAEHGERMGWSPGYNFTSLDAARIRWRAAIAAGVDFVATDQYEDYAQIR